MNKRIPTALALFILLAGLVAGVILVNSRTSFQSKAGPTENPKNIKISNRSASGFSLSWTTDIPMTGYLKYSEDPTKINLPAGDVRDQISGTSQSYTNHYINVTGLGANKTYYFVIGSGSQTYNDNGKPYQMRTQSALSLPAEDVISGKIVGSDNAPANGVIVFIEIDGAESLSTVTKNDGSWRVNLSTARSKDGKVVSIDPLKTLLSIFVQGGTLGTATALSSTEKSRPVPDIVLGKNQSFVDGGIVLADSLKDTSTRSGSFSMTESLLTEGNVLGVSETVTFLNPAIEGELIATTSPEFKLKLATGSGLTLSVGDQKNGSELVKNSFGEWVWSPSLPLSTGLNTLLVEYLDTKNNKQQVSRSFNVLSIGDTSGIPAFTATPSATPTLAVVDVTPTQTETTTMPETNSENLVDSGTIEQSIIAMISGLIIFMVGRRLKKKWN